MASEYLQKLCVENPDVGERYQLKLKLINYLDPFTLKEDELDYSIDGIPPVTNLDIVSYLILSHSYYTKEQMKAFMRIVEPFATEMCDKSAVTLKSKLDIFSEEFVGKPHSALIELSKKYDLAVTQEEVVCIEEATRSQFRNPNWYAQRAGRITASKFKEVCRTNPSKPSLSLLKAICYPAQVLFRSKATDWGIKHEDNAAEEYRCNMEEVHEGFVINEVGFMISQKWPQFGASPDRLVYCECCRGGCLEIKCPYVFHENNIDNINDYVKLKNSCLVVEDDVVVLNRKHAYYYQVQMQIFVTQLEYCDFVVWSPKVFFKERIYPNFQFWEKYSAIAQEFHANIIMPELLARYFTKQEGAAEIKYWCVCKGVDDRTPMIKCDNGSCEIKWFHFTCVGLSSVPSNIWYCDNCRS